MSFIRGELIDYKEDVAICWVEIAVGEMVKISLPATQLKELEVVAGGEFAYNSETNKAAHFYFLLSEEEITQRELAIEKIRKEFNDLRQKFMTLRKPR